MEELALALTLRGAHDTHVYRLLVLPDGRLVSGDANGQIFLWSMDRDKYPDKPERFSKLCNAGFINYCSFLINLPKTNTLVVGFKYGDIKTIDLDSRELHVSFADGDEINHAVSLGNRAIATLSDTHVAFWDALNGLRLPVERAKIESWPKLLDAYGLPRLTACYATEGNSLCRIHTDRLAIGTSTGEILIIKHHKERKAFVEQDRLKAHDSFVTTLCMSSCGRYLLSGSEDRTLSIWRAPFDEADKFRWIQRIKCDDDVYDVLDLSEPGDRSKVVLAIACGTEVGIWTFKDHQAEEHQEEQEVKAVEVGETEKKAYYQFDSRAESLAVDWESRSLFCGTQNGEIYFFNLNKT